MPLAATWMNLEIIVLSEVSQTEKDKYISLTCGLLKKTKKIQMNLHTNGNRPTDIENKVMITKGGKGVG